ncbi:hypothetical protein GL213_12840 [Halogeometricum borinquense]|uniref:Uncharacterized protein n=1 Tax=Halogeometricum borinquense TaxID=60847 RepID=A0A6C0UDM4_9EURY|nr:hypothetical protein [Halogeometricum borinquense]QIB73270.1 hypothetical protein G3I44_02600 [Halogeometricum borinquense]QIQ77335.1 hypothetical protein GL213_12840 [Halogeometricum borinquense]
MDNIDRQSNRNRVLSGIAVLAAGLLVAAATGAYRAFSFLAIGLLVGTIAVASVERNVRELDFAPYNGLVVGWTVVFTVGFTGIWMLWNPSVTSYTYVLGLPTPTLVYATCIWLFPILGAFYYAFVFDEIGDDDIVEGIMTDAREAQRGQNIPLGQEVKADGSGGSAGTEMTDGGED